MSICRFCQKHGHDSQMVKYGVRHYAHFDCFLDAGKDISSLQIYQLGRFPYRLLKDRNLFDLASRLLAQT